MPLMEWNEKLSVGVQQFDSEHKKLVGMVNDLFDAVQAGRGKDILGPILDGLIGYTKTHFANEERYMTQHGFPGLAAHKAEHDALAKQVLGGYSDLRGPPPMSRKVLSQSSDLLTFTSIGL